MTVNVELSRREAYFLVAAMEMSLENHRRYIALVDDGKSPDHDPAAFELSKQFYAEKLALVEKLREAHPGL